MKNLSILRKNLVMFGALIAIVIGLVAFALAELSAVNDASQEISDQDIPHLEQVNAINLAMSDYVNAQQAHVLSTTDDWMRKYEAVMANRRSLIEAKIDGFRRKGPDATELRMLDFLAADWGKYLALSHKAVALSRLNQNEQAAAQVRGSQELVDLVSDRVDKFAAYESAQAKAGAAAADATYSSAKWLLLVAVAFVLAAMVAVLMTLVRTIAVPLARMTQAMGELAEGNMAVEVPVEPRRDEVGDLARVMTVFRDRLAAAEREKQAQTELIVSSVGTALGKLANGELVARIDADLTGPFARLKNDFNEAAAQLSGAVRSVSKAAHDINTGSSEIRCASDDLASRTEQQAASIEETTAAMKQVTSMVQETAREAADVSHWIADAEKEAHEGGRVVGNAVEAMNTIAQSSQKITSIIDVIDGIAFQTNLLALNAGVEAARAGDAGKGFAVVANEVRALAQRSADAARDIKELIGMSGDQVNRGVALVDETGVVLGRIVKRIVEINNSIAKISQAAEAQAVNLEQVNDAVVGMDRMTQQNAAMVEESTAAARNLAEEANELAALVARFDTGATAAAVHTVASFPKAGGRRNAGGAAPVVHGALALQTTPASEEDWAEF